MITIARRQCVGVENALRWRSGQTPRESSRTAAEWKSRHRTVGKAWRWSPVIPWKYEPEHVARDEEFAAQLRRRGDASTWAWNLAIQYDIGLPTRCDLCPVPWTSKATRTPARSITCSLSGPTRESFVMLTYRVPSRAASPTRSFLVKMLPAGSTVDAHQHHHARPQRQSRCPCRADRTASAPP